MELSLQELKLIKIALEETIDNHENNIRRENLKEVDIQTVVSVETMKVLLKKLQEDSILEACN